MREREREDPYKLLIGSNNTVSCPYISRELASWNMIGSYKKCINQSDFSIGFLAYMSDKTQCSSGQSGMMSCSLLYGLNNIMFSSVNVAGWIGWRSGIILTPMLTHLADHFVYLFGHTTTSTLLVKVKVPCLVIAQIYSKENPYLELVESRFESIILDPLDFSQQWKLIIAWL